MDGVQGAPVRPEITRKLDVVYPLSKMAKGPEDLELRYSLRSLDRQPWAGNVFLVGHKPAWIKNAYQIEFPDSWNPTAFKDKNIIKKMLRACVDGRVSDPFIANSDDQYWLKPIGPEDMLIPPRENPPQMELDRISKQPNKFRPWKNRWVKRQYDTIDYLRKNGKCTIAFDGHVPYVIHKEKYLQTMAHIPWELDNGFLIVVYHGWTWETPRNGFRIEDKDGVLIRVRMEMTREQIEKKAETEKALFLNHNNKAFSQGMREFLERRFPNPSRWE